MEGIALWFQPLSLAISLMLVCALAPSLPVLPQAIGASPLQEELGKTWAGEHVPAHGAAELPWNELLQSVLIRACRGAFCSLPEVVWVVAEGSGVSVGTLSDEGKRREMIALISVGWRKCLGELCVCVQDKL